MPRLPGGKCNCKGIPELLSSMTFKQFQVYSVSFESLFFPLVCTLYLMPSIDRNAIPINNKLISLVMMVLIQIPWSDLADTWCAKDKAIPVTGHEGPLGCERSRLPHFLDNWLTDGSEGVSLRCWPPFTPQEDSWYSFPLEAESTPGP
jgi:hypothetical protein